MKYFVTGASGFIGQAVIKELLSSGHTVLGLARSDASAEKVKALGAEVHRGSLDDAESLKSGAAASDGVAHLAFAHDFSGEMDMAAWCATDRAAISAIAEGLKGSNKPLVVTSATLVLAPGKPVTEEDRADETNPLGAARGPSETLVLGLEDEGIRSSIVRLSPTNHGEGDHGFIDTLIKISQGQGSSAYVGEGANVWSAVHRRDTAKLFALALEKGKAGSVYHAVAEAKIPYKAIAEAIAERTSLPVKSLTMEEGQNHFGGMFFAVLADNHATAEKTKKELGWEPTNPTLFEDIKGDAYFPKA